MADDTGKPSLLKIADLLHSHSVEFAVIGGQAAVLHGSPIPTFDVDLSYRCTPQNLQRLASPAQKTKQCLFSSRRYNGFAKVVAPHGEVLRLCLQRRPPAST
jgi:hypothetical protein